MEPVRNELAKQVLGNTNYVIRALKVPYEVCLSFSLNLNLNDEVELKCFGTCVVAFLEAIDLLTLLMAILFLFLPFFPPLLLSLRSR